jgi:hypothetical protein
VVLAVGPSCSIWRRGRPWRAVYDVLPDAVDITPAERRRRPRVRRPISQPARCPWRLRRSKNEPHSSTSPPLRWLGTPTAGLGPTRSGSAHEPHLLARRARVAAREGGRTGSRAVITQSQITTGCCMTRALRAGQQRGAHVDRSTTGNDESGPAQSPPPSESSPDATRHTSNTVACTGQADRLLAIEGRTAHLTAEHFGGELADVINDPRLAWSSGPGITARAARPPAPRARRQVAIGPRRRARSPKTPPQRVAQSPPQTGVTKLHPERDCNPHQPRVQPLAALVVLPAVRRRPRQHGVDLLQQRNQQLLGRAFRWRSPSCSWRSRPTGLSSEISHANRDRRPVCAPVSSRGRGALIVPALVLLVGLSLDRRPRRPLTLLALVPTRSSARWRSGTATETYRPNGTPR